LNYLLDTNIASYLMERRPSIVSRVGEAGGPGLLSISTVTLAELDYGVRIMPEGRRRTGRLDDLEKMLGTGMDVRPFSVDAARVYSEAGATLRAAGIAFKFPDLAIASIAIAENKTLASNDAFFEHVERLCGLRFERWEP
jgi:predicted nucleic acid-binding protein